MQCPTALAYVREAKRLRTVAAATTTSKARKALLDRAADYQVLAEGGELTPNRTMELVSSMAPGAGSMTPEDDGPLA